MVINLAWINPEVLITLRSVEVQIQSVKNCKRWDKLLDKLVPGGSGLVSLGFSKDMVWLRLSRPTRGSPNLLLWLVERVTTELRETMTGFSGSPRKIFDHLICNYKNSKFTYEIVRENDDCAVRNNDTFLWCGSHLSLNEWLRCPWPDKFIRADWNCLLT